MPMATMDSEEPADVLGRFAKRFPANVSRLATVQTTNLRGSMGATSRIIRRNADRGWTLATDYDGEMFDTRSTRRQLRVNPTNFARLLSHIVSQFDAVSESHLREVYDALGDPSDRREVISDLFAMIFMAHELLHIDQRLGSDQYKDSDAYPLAVAETDYQADVAAFVHVLAVAPTAHLLSTRQSITLMMAVHIATMQAFPTDGTISRDAFDRRLIWHFQLARAMRSTAEPSLLHPCVQRRPVIELPQYRALTGDGLTEDHFTVPRNDAAGTKQDVVVAVADGRGVVSIHRLASTDDDRIRVLAKGVLRGNFSAVRDALEEFFADNAIAMDYGRASRHQLAFEKLVADGQSLLDADPVVALLPGSPRVVSFFEHAAYLLEEMPPRSIPKSLRPYAERWAGGCHDLHLLLVDELGDSWRTQSDNAVSHVVRRELLRVQLRFAGLVQDLATDE